ncbi:MAG: hypothetical protein GTO63_25460 [Anaerolineae bacterium]|nr:hypothetical protein [Anaerolineae bacterium]NIN98079.1 hypothetical protein [Anaerolineae bacterium]
MEIGMLWFDDSSRPIKDKVRRAVDFYKQKYGRKPTVCLVNPQTLNGGEGSVAGVQIRRGANVMLDHFWIGVEETVKAPRQKRRQRKAA